MKARILRAKIKWDQRSRKYEWSVSDLMGVRFAYGEEPRLHHAYEIAHDTVVAIQTWSMVGRGSLHIPDDGLTVAIQPGRRAS